MSVPDCFDYSGLVIQFDIRYFDPSPTLLFFLKIAEVIQGYFWLHINFWSICSRSVKYAIGILIGIELNL